MSHREVPGERHIRPAHPPPARRGDHVRHQPPITGASSPGRSPPPGPPPDGRPAPLPLTGLDPEPADHSPDHPPARRRSAARQETTSRGPRWVIQTSLGVTVDPEVYITCGSRNAIRATGYPGRPAGRPPPPSTPATAPRPAPPNTPSHRDRIRGLSACARNNSGTASVVSFHPVISCYRSAGARISACLIRSSGAAATIQSRILRKRRLISLPNTAL